MTYKSDGEIKSEVMFQLGWDSRINQIALRIGFCSATYGPQEQSLELIATAPRTSAETID
ncbi:MAG TPA: hypothetical protein VJ302_05640 [Blastocatellia bacterium]|nr:hypothetical protein [Blastocatellia bacterium]